MLAKWLCQGAWGTYYIFMRGGSFAAWSKAPTKVGAALLKTWEIGELSPLFAFLKDGSLVLKEDISGS